MDLGLWFFGNWTIQGSEKGSRGTPQQWPALDLHFVPSVTRQRDRPGGKYHVQSRQNRYTTMQASRASPTICALLARVIDRV